MMHVSNSEIITGLKIINYSVLDVEILRYEGIKIILS